MKPKFLFIATAVVGIFSANLQAAVIYWDGGTVSITTNGDGISQGGSGTWDGSIKNWDKGSGLGHIAWNKRYTASFGGTAGTVTLGAALTVASLTFTTDGYILTGLSVLSINSGGIIANSSTTLNGPLKLTAAQSWTVATGKTLTIGGAVATNAKILTIAGAGNTLLSGVASGTGALTKTGVGLLTLSGANTYTGITTLSDGVTNLGIAEVAGTSGPLGKPATTLGSLLFTGGTLQYSSVNNFDYSARFSTAGGQTWSIDTNGRDVTYSTALAGATSSLSKLGTGILTLSVASNFTGGTTISAGALNVTGSLADTGAITVNGGIYTVGANDTVGVITLTSGTINGSAILTASSYDVQSGSINTILAGSGALTKSTAGSVTLSGASTFTGGTTLSAGTLNVTGTLADAGTVTVNGGTYTVGANDTVGTVTLASGIINGSANLTGSSYAVQSGSISAILAGSGGLTKSTGGVVTLSGVNTYTGATLINAGSLIVNGSLASGSAVSLASGAILSGTGTISGTVTVANSATSEIMVGDGVTGRLNLGNLTFNGAAKVDIGTLGNYTSTSALNVTGALTLNSGAGTVTLALPAGVLSNGTYHLISHNNVLTNLAGIAVTGPATGARQVAALANNTGVIDYVVSGDTPFWTGAAGSAWNTIATNWKLVLAGTNTQFIANDAVLFTDSATGSTTVDIAANVNPAVTSFTNSTKNYILQGGAGITTGSLTKSGSGILAITNANSYADGTTLSAGVLQIGNNSALGAGNLNLNGGTLSSDSITGRTLSNAITMSADVTLGNGTQNGALSLSGNVDLLGATRQITTAAAITFSGVIINGALTATGSGVLVLTGQNTYSGGTVLNGGTLAINSSASLGNASAALVFGGNSTLRIAASFSTTRGYTINSGVMATIDTNTYDLAHGGIISGSGSLIKTGVGILTLSGVNNFAGTTTISGGTLALSGGSALPDNASVTLANSSGAVLLLNASETLGSLSGGGATDGLVNLQSNTLTVAGGATTTFAGVISGTGSLIQSGAGVLTLAGTNTFSGATTLSAGTLGISADSGLGAVPGSVTPGKLVLSGGTLATTATFTMSSNRGITAGGALNVASGTTLTYGGIAAGSGVLTKSGLGTLTLAGANTYTGATLINEGNLIVNGSLASGSAVTITTDATLSGIGTVSGNVTGNAGAIITAGNGLSNSLKIGGNLSFGGDGIINIGPLSNYINSAALEITGSLTTVDTLVSVVFNLPTSSLTLGTYHLASHNNNINNTDFAVYSVLGPVIGARQTGTLTNNNSMIDYVVTGANPYWTGATNGAWDTTTTNNWKLIGANTVTTFQAVNDVVLFDDNATGTTTVSIAAGVAPLSTTFANSTKNYTLQGAAGITNGSLTKSGTGTLTITNANSYNDGTTLTAGILQVGNNSALGTGLVALNGGTLSSDSTTARALSNSVALGGDMTLGNTTNSGSLTFSGPVDFGGATRQIATASGVTMSGTLSNGGLTKAGTGQLTLSNSNTYTGPTNVNSGRLIVGVGGIGSITSDVSVASGAILGGTGTIIGSFTLAQEATPGAKNGGTLAVGNGIGIQTVTGTSSFNTGSIFSWELDTDAVAFGRGTEYDGLNTASINGSGAVFQISLADVEGFGDNFWSANHTWTDIFKSANGSTSLTNDWSSLFSSFSYTNGTNPLTPVNGSFSWTNSGNTLSWSVVPEPTTALAGLLLISGMLRRRRGSLALAK